MGPESAEEILLNPKQSGATCLISSQFISNVIQNRENSENIYVRLADCRSIDATIKNGSDLTLRKLWPPSNSRFDRTMPQ